MLRLRPYKECDAKTIVSWCKDEQSLRRWSSDRYDHYPITSDDINKKYFDCNGDCPEMDNFYPMTAFDESGVVGHLIMRFTDAEKRFLRFGFVIVDDSKRGKGYGKEMLRLAIRYGFEILKAEQVNLGVFDNNMPAYHCYKAAGFRDVEVAEKETFRVNDEIWTVLELAIEKEEYLKFA